MGSGSPSSAALSQQNIFPCEPPSALARAHILRPVLQGMPARFHSHCQKLPGCRIPSISNSYTIWGLQWDVLYPGFVPSVVEPRHMVGFHSFTSVRFGRDSSAHLPSQDLSPLKAKHLGTLFFCFYLRLCICDMMTSG
jgi:hypothetical protein